jgi:hypothetical protein
MKMMMLALHHMILHPSIQKSENVKSYQTEKVGARPT